MSKRIRRHRKHITPKTKPIIKEKLHKKRRNFYLNEGLKDRISFSVLINDKNDTKKIENISYEIQIKSRWVWVVRYDDHGGIGSLHKHFRVSLDNDQQIESSTEIEKIDNKNDQLTWVCKDIRANYLAFRDMFLSNCKLDLY